MNIEDYKTFVDSLSKEDLEQISYFNKQNINYGRKLSKALLHFTTLEKYENPVTKKENICELQEILVQTCIDYINKHNLTDIYSAEANYATKEPIFLQLTGDLCEELQHYIISGKNTKMTYGGDIDNLLSAMKAKTKEVADVCEMYVKIPADHIYVIKNSKTCNAADKSKGAIKSLENQLCGSVFEHKANLLFYFIINYESGKIIFKHYN